MSNVDRALQLLEELERIDREGAAGEQRAAEIPTSAVLRALRDADFDLYSAIVSVARDA